MNFDLRSSESGREILLAIILLGLLTSIFWAPSLFAQQGGAQSSQRWVSDQFEVTMRSGKDNRKAILRMLPSGAQLELLEEDAEAGYSRVKVSSGAEGWVLNRYLMKSPPARQLLPDLEGRLRKSQEKRGELERDMRSLRTERGELQRQSSQLEKSGSGLQEELDEVRRLSSSVIEVNDQNKQLKRRLIENERLLDELKAENNRLAARSNREWFVIGALVVIFGILIGLILPRIRWRKKSGWGEL